ncbi:hypothetical protein ABZV60_27375 [Streptomyces sp. NPDC004787]|uniref:hypothetical protein n=1 Tax=Streptomyces sp. NPDC004787 TaxID=3154291 RepID=UPI0033BF183E
MITVIAAVAAGLIATGVFYEIARLITPDEPRCPPLARVAGRRPALDAAERWAVGLRLHDRIDQAAYQARMAALAHGQRRPQRSSRTHTGGRHG